MRWGPVLVVMLVVLCALAFPCHGEEYPLRYRSDSNAKRYLGDIGQYTPRLWYKAPLGVIAQGFEHRPQYSGLPAPLAPSGIVGFALVRRRAGGIS